MKTAMQELQDALEIYSRHNKGTQEGKEIDIILSAFPEFIEAEKQQIIEAFEAGTKEDLFNTWSIPEELYKKEKSAEYFQQTFKSDE